MLRTAMVDEELLCQLRLPLKGSNSRELNERFPAVCAWISQLSSAVGSYRIEWRTGNHRILGANDIPAVTCYINALIPPLPHFTRSFSFACETWPLEMNDLYVGIRNLR